MILVTYFHYTPYTHVLPWGLVSPIFFMGRDVGPSSYEVEQKHGATFARPISVSIRFGLTLLPRPFVWTSHTQHFHRHIVGSLRLKSRACVLLRPLESTPWCNCSKPTFTHQNIALCTWHDTWYTVLDMTFEWSLKTSILNPQDKTWRSNSSAMSSAVCTT